MLALLRIIKNGDVAAASAAGWLLELGRASTIRDAAQVSALVMNYLHACAGIRVAYIMSNMLHTKLLCKLEHTIANMNFKLGVSHKKHPATRTRYGRLSRMRVAHASLRGCSTARSGSGFPSIKLLMLKLMDLHNMHLMAQHNLNDDSPLTRARRHSSARAALTRCRGCSAARTGSATSPCS